MSRLHYAARRGRTEELVEGIQAGLDVNERTAHYFTPLHLAAQEGHVNCVEVLIAAGADLLAAHPNGRTALHFSACGGHLAVVQALIESGLDPDCGSNRTAALEAAMFNRVDVVHYLIEKGADPNACDRGGRNISHWLDLGGVQGIPIEPRRPRSDLKLLEGIRRCMAESSSVEEHAARFGRHTYVFGYPGMDLSVDPEADAWARRFYEILGQPDLLAECEDRYLTGEELRQVQTARERHKKATVRRAAKRAP